MGPLEDVWKAAFIHELVWVSLLTMLNAVADGGVADVGRVGCESIRFPAGKPLKARGAVFKAFCWAIGETVLVWALVCMVGFSLFRAAGMLREVGCSSDTECTWLPV